MRVAIWNVCFIFFGIIFMVIVLIKFSKYVLEP